MDQLWSDRSCGDFAQQFVFSVSSIKTTRRQQRFQKFPLWRDSTAHTVWFSRALEGFLFNCWPGWNLMFDPRHWGLMELWREEQWKERQSEILLWRFGGIRNIGNIDLKMCTQIILIRQPKTFSCDHSMSLNTEFHNFHYMIILLWMSDLRSCLTHSWRTLYTFTALKKKKKDHSNRIKCPPTNVSLSAVRALFGWLRLNVTKAGSSGTTGTVGSISRTIKQSEQFRVRLQRFHTTGNELLQSDFFSNSQLCSRVTDSTWSVLVRPSSLYCNVTNLFCCIRIAFHDPRLCLFDLRFSI